MLVYFILFFQVGDINHLDLVFDSLMDIGMFEKATVHLDSYPLKDISKDELLQFNLNKGEVHRILGQKDSASYFLHRGFSNLSTQPSKIRLNYLLELSKLNRDNGNYKEAKKYGYQSLDLLSELNDSSFYYRALVTFGNVFYYEGLLDSTLVYYSKAEKYIDEKSFEQRAILINNQGNLLVENGSLRSSIQKFDQAEALFSKAQSKLREFQAQINKVYPLLELGELKEAEEINANAIKTAEENNWEEQRIMALNQRTLILSKKHNIPELISLEDTLSEIIHRRLGKEVLELEEQYQNERLEKQNLSLSLKSEQRKRNNLILLSILSASLLLGFMYIRNLRIKNQLELAEGELKRQTALEAERNRIAGEMHDDLGGGLTTIKFLNDRLKRRLNETKDIELTEKIGNHSQKLITNMSEIIWAMNSKFDDLESTIAYLRRVSKEYMTDVDIPLQFIQPDQLVEKPLTSLLRRNLLLVMKEALHNVAKHSEASKVTIEFIQHEKSLEMLITDNGKGILKENIFGNGLQNMKERIEALKGEFNLIDAQPGVTVQVKLSTP